MHEIIPSQMQDFPIGLAELHLIDCGSYLQFIQVIVDPCSTFQRYAILPNLETDLEQECQTYGRWARFSLRSCFVWPAGLLAVPWNVAGMAYCRSWGLQALVHMEISSRRVNEICHSLGHPPFCLLSLLWPYLRSLVPTACPVLESGARDAAAA